MGGFCEVVQFSKDKLFERLTNTRCLVQQDDLSVTYLYQYLEHLHCKTMVVENVYIDRDFLDDFSHYYVRCFQDYERFCRRIHFFVDFDEAEFSKFLLEPTGVEELARELDTNYLGFVVVKPLPEAIIGRTVLVPWEETVQFSEDEPGKRSIRCVRKYEANLAGLDLHVTGLAFQEQDKVLAACATSALWSAFQRTSYLFNHTTPTLYEITTRATQYLQIARTIPSEGLSVSQMCQAIREAGLEAEIKEIIAKPRVRGNKYVYKYPLLSAAYGYLRAGIPILLEVYIRGRGQHAVTLVGYRVGEQGPGMNELKLWYPGLTLRLKGARIIKLYAHDDQIGPYCRMPVQPGVHREGEPQYPLELGSDWRNVSGDPTTLIPFTMILPTYHKIRVPFASTISLASRLELLLRGSSESWTQLEWDIFLSSINDYKREIARRTDLAGEMRKRVLAKSHPRFIWRARAFADGFEVCEMLIDATDMELSFQAYHLNVLDNESLESLRMLVQDVPEPLREDPIDRFMIDFVQAQVAEY